MISFLLSPLLVSVLFSLRVERRCGDVCGTCKRSLGRLWVCLVLVPGVYPILPIAVPLRYMADESCSTLFDIGNSVVIQDFSIVCLNPHPWSVKLPLPLYPRLHLVVLGRFHSPI